MSDRKQALTDLLEKVEEGEQPQPKDFRAALEVPMQDMRYTQMPNDARAAYGGNLNSAQALHEAVLPRHYAQVHMWPMPEMCRVDIGGGHTGRDDNPARAWLIAIFKALIAKEGDT